MLRQRNAGDSTGLAGEMVGHRWVGVGPVSSTDRSASRQAPARENQLRKIVALGLVVFHGGVAATPVSIEGSYVATTLNGRALPADLRLPATAGDFRLFRLEQGVLRLSRGGRFTLYFRYYHQLVRLGARPIATPVLSESEAGTYTLKDHQLILVPSRKKNARSRPTIVATISGEEIRASYVLESGSARERVALVLRRDESYW